MGTAYARYDDSFYTGKLAVAEIAGGLYRFQLPGEFDITRYKAKILTGPKQIENKHCYVVKRLGAENENAGTNLVIRLNIPRSLGKEYKPFLFGNSVTSKVPSGFEYAEAGDALLWGVWTKEMDEMMDVYSPCMPDVNSVFDIGDMFRTVHIVMSGGKRPKPLSDLLHAKFGCERIGGNPIEALAEYVRRMRTDERVWESSPLVMTIDEESENVINMNVLLNPRKIGVKRCIRMDPAPVFQGKKRD